MLLGMHLYAHVGKLAETDVYDTLLKHSMLARQAEEWTLLMRGWGWESVYAPVPILARHKPRRTARARPGRQSVFMSYASILNDFLATRVQS